MLNDVQILRAAAALGVVMVHIALFNSAALGVWFEFGRYGVDLFFVISGFVMIYTVSKRPVTGWEFMRNRIIRIVPMYWAFTLGVYLLVLLWPAALKSTTNDPLDLIKSLFFIPYRKANGLMHPVLFLGWTLNYEMFFYAIFACSLSIRTALTRAITMIATLALLVIIGQLAKPTSDIATFYTSPLLLEFGYGIVIGMLYPWFSARVPVWAGAMMLIIGLSGWFVIPLSMSITLRVVQLGIPAVLSMTGALVLDANKRTASSPALLLFGAASYAIYLVHPFVLGMVGHMATKLHLLYGPALLLTVIAATMAALVSGVVLHLGFERPVDRFLRRWSRPGAGSPMNDKVALWPWKRA